MQMQYKDDCIFSVFETKPSFMREYDYVEKEFENNSSFEDLAADF